MRTTQAKEVWRWNADPIWLQFCSMFYESHFASVAPHDFARQHHTRACLYFAVGAVETFLNRRMRAKLEQDGATEAEIYDQLRWGKLNEKARKWPSQLAGRNVSISEAFFEALEYVRELRDEVTHQKRRDHSLYVEIDQSHTAPIVNAIVEAMITIDEVCGRGYPFPDHPDHASAVTSR